MQMSQDPVTRTQSDKLHHKNWLVYGISVLTTLYNSIVCIFVFNKDKRAIMTIGYSGNKLLNNNDRSVNSMTQNITLLSLTSL